jgi:hypothetical protein
MLRSLLWIGVVALGVVAVAQDAPPDSPPVDEFLLPVPPAPVAVEESSQTEPPLLTEPDALFDVAASTKELPPSPAPAPEPLATPEPETSSESSVKIAIGPDPDDVWPKPHEFATTRWWPSQGGMTWLPGHRDRFGMFSWTSQSAFAADDWGGLSITHGSGFHFLNGPVQTDLPSKLFDFHWGVHWAGEVMPGWSADLAFSFGVYSDFEDSARDGWRFPSHAVVFYDYTPEVHPVLGVRYLDRNSLTLAPVAGVVLRPDDRVRAELLFPEPRLAIRVGQSEEKEHWLTFSGQIGGGQWAIERSNTDLADVVTYNDYRAVLGFETHMPGMASSAFEAGYVFARDLEYRSGVGDFAPPDTFFVRLVTRH